jgi:CBS domain containing-hemolysin-like protein
MHVTTTSNTEGKAPISSDDSASSWGLVKWLKRQLGAKPESSLKEVLEDVLDDEGSDALKISEEEKNILKNIVDFSTLSVGDVMVPRTEIKGVEKSVTGADLAKHVEEIGHTRIPIYDGSLDKIEGFLHVKDLFIALSKGNEICVVSAMRSILFIPPSMRIVDLLLKMRVSGCHMAIVVDEYGGTDGLVTMEDLIEELVGEIQDEHDLDDDEAMMHWLREDVLEVDARSEIEDVEEMLGARLTQGDVHALDFDTIGGLVFAKLGRVPVRGEVLQLDDFKIEVLQADPRRIRRLRITKRLYAR